MVYKQSFTQRMKLAVEGKTITCGGETLAEGIAVKKPGGVTLPVVNHLLMIYY